MRLNLSSDYALRLLMYLATHTERLCTITEIANHYTISRSHLMKVTHGLAQNGWITTVRGKNGGMQLARPATEIRIGAVILDCESDFQLVECMGTPANVYSTARVSLMASLMVPCKRL